MTWPLNQCPECGGANMLITMRVGVIRWMRCAMCGWDEKHQLETKIREELANGDGIDDDARTGA